MFDPLVGRFLEEDPIKFAAGDPNLYRYVRNNPTNATDPSGMYIVVNDLKTATELGKVIKAATGLDLRPADQLKNGQYIIREFDQQNELRAMHNALGDNARHPNRNRGEKHRIHDLLAALTGDARPSPGAVVVESVTGNSLDKVVSWKVSERGHPQRDQLDRLVLSYRGDQVQLVPSDLQRLTWSREPTKVDYTMFRQGGTNTCAKASMIVAYAYHSPQDIANRVKIKDDGTVDVSLYVGGRLYVYNVKPDLSQGQRQVNHWNCLDGAIWADAFALALEQKMGKASFVDSRKYTWGLPQITGTSVEEYHNFLDFGFGPAITLKPQMVNTEALLSRANKGVVITASPGKLDIDESVRNQVIQQAGPSNNPPEVRLGYLVTKNHYYAVVGYDPVKKQVHLIDPAFEKSDLKSRREPGWGLNEYWVTLEEFKSTMRVLVVADALLNPFGG